MTRLSDDAHHPQITLRAIAEWSQGYGDRIAFHPDGRQWATAQFDQLHLWEGLTLTRSLRLPYTPPGRFLFNEEGTLLYLGPLQIEPSSGQVVDLLQESLDVQLRPPGAASQGQYELAGAAWSSDGEEGVVFIRYRAAMGIGTGDGEHLPASRLLRLRRQDPEVQILLEGSAFDAYHTIALHKHYVAAAHLSIGVWSRLKGEQVAELSYHTNGIRDLQFSADGAWLASIGADGQATLWTTQDWVRHASWQAHEEEGRVLAFHPQLNCLATGGWDRQLKVWSLGSQPECLLTRSLPDHVEGIAFAPRGDQLIVAARFREATLFLYALLL